MSITYETKVTAEVTPKDIARLFWNMDDSEQCEFFEALAHVVYEDGDEVNQKMGAETQWYYLGRKLMENPIARSVVAALSAGIWEHTLRYCDKQFANRDMPWKDELQVSA